jgi:hypothetical protein
LHVRTRGSSGRVNGKPVKRYPAVWFENGRRHTETFVVFEQAAQASRSGHGSWWIPKPASISPSMTSATAPGRVAPPA